MRRLRQLTPQEVLFVGGETSTVYQHPSGLTLPIGHGRWSHKAVVEWA
jgi:hypothetical protein